MIDVSNERIKIIDSLRGLVMIFILITHFSWDENERLLYGFPYWILMAVPILIMISGYVNTISVKRKGIDDVFEMYEVEYWLPKVLRYTLPYMLIYVYNGWS